MKNDAINFNSWIRKNNFMQLSENIGKFSGLWFKSGDRDDMNYYTIDELYDKFEKDTKVKFDKNQLPKLNWEQSDFVPNCPIYYVKKDDRLILRIEYVFSKLGNYWTIGLFGNSDTVVDNPDMNDFKKIQTLAEHLFKNYVKELYTLTQDI